MIKIVCDDSSWTNIHHSRKVGTKEYICSSLDFIPTLKKKTQQKKVTPPFNNCSCLLKKDKHLMKIWKSLIMKWQVWEVPTLEAGGLWFPCAWRPPCCTAECAGGLCPSEISPALILSADGEEVLRCLLLCRREFAEAASPRGLGEESHFEIPLTAAWLSRH